MEPFTLKSGTNRGHRRIWIEGNRLLKAGFFRGDSLLRVMQDDGTMLLYRDEHSDKLRPEAIAGNHTIAGKDDRPILDLCGHWVTDFIDGHSHFSVTPLGQSDHKFGLIITPCNKS